MGRKAFDIWLQVLLSPRGIWPQAHHVESVISKRNQEIRLPSVQAIQLAEFAIIQPILTRASD